MKQIRNGNEIALRWSMHTNSILSSDVIIAMVYERDFVTVLGTLWLCITRTRGESFNRRRVSKARAGIIAAHSGSIFARHQHSSGRTSSGDSDWQDRQCANVSKLTRDLDEAVQQFHEAPLSDDWGYLSLDGVNLKARRESGRKCVQMLVAYGGAPGWPARVAFIHVQPGRESGERGKDS